MYRKTNILGSIQFNSIQIQFNSIQKSFIATQNIAYGTQQFYQVWYTTILSSKTSLATDIIWNVLVTMSPGWGIWKRYVYMLYVDVYKTITEVGLKITEACNLIMVFKICEELYVIVHKKYFPCTTMLNFGHSVPHTTSEPGDWGGN